MVTLTPLFPVTSLKPHSVSSKQEPHRDQEAQHREQGAQSPATCFLSGISDI